jgi:uncharacterized membrane protein YcaP (DUF421 family)
MFFHSWWDILRIFVIGTLSYACLMVVLRITGKRALSKMNAFDFVVTVAMGSALASVILSKDVVLAEGVAAFAVLCGLQYASSLIFLKFPRFKDFAQAHPSLLMYRGVYYKHEMRKTRITEEEVISALRQRGVRWDQAQAVILETDGSLTVIPKSEHAAGKIFEGVEPHPYDKALVRDSTTADP